MLFPEIVAPPATTFKPPAVTSNLSDVVNVPVTVLLPTNSTAAAEIETLSPVAATAPTAPAAPASSIFVPAPTSIIGAASTCIANITPKASGVKAILFVFIIFTPIPIFPVTDYCHEYKHHYQNRAGSIVSLPSG